MKLKLRDKIKRPKMIAGNEYTVWEGYAKISDLQFWDSNPRIYSLLERERLENIINKQVIYQTMVTFPDFDKLKRDIRDDGAINEPVIVCKNPVNDQYTVYEGNTRLAVAIQLSENDKPSKRRSWTEMFVQVLPDGTEEKVINRLIGVMQLTGKYDWRKFEEAGYLYREVKNEIEEKGSNKSDAQKTVANTYGIPFGRVKKAFVTCEFMIENHKMSYGIQEKYYGYWELLSSGTGNIKHLRKAFNNPDFIRGKINNPSKNAFDKMIIKKIKDGKEVQRISGASKDGGTAFRNDIAFIADAYVKNDDIELIADLMDEKISISQAVERAKMGGIGSAEFDKVKDFANWLCSARTMKDLQNAIVQFPEMKKEIDTIFERAQIATSKLEKNLKKKTTYLNNDYEDHLVYKLCILMALSDKILHPNEIQKIYEILNSGEWLIGDIKNHDVLDAVEQVSREVYQYNGIEKTANIYGKLLKSREAQKTTIKFMEEVMLADKVRVKQEIKLLQQLRKLWEL